MASLIAPIFLAWLVIELVTFVLVAQHLGAIKTLLLIVLSSVSGYLLLRGEGIALARRLAGFIQHAQRTGEVPPLPVAESLPRFIAGALLLLPGFANDVLAILVLLPPLRGYVVRRVQAFIASRHHHVLRERGIIDIDGETLPDPDDEGPPPPPEPPPGLSGPRRMLPPPS